MNNDNDYIPAADEVKAPERGMSSWRIADGKICRGRPTEGTLETCERLVGRLVRVGIHDGLTKDGGRYTKLDCVLRTSEGEVLVTAPLSDTMGARKVSLSALGFGEALLDVATSELITITASQSTKPNRFGKFNTYANVFHTDPKTLNQRPTARLQSIRRELGLTMDEQWEIVEAGLRTHPAWGARPVRAQDDEGAAPGMGHLVALCRERNWPTPEEAPGVWLKKMAEVKKEATPRASLAEWPDEVWLQTAGAMSTLPPALPSWLEANTPAPVEAGVFA